MLKVGIAYLPLFKSRIMKHVFYTLDPYFQQRVGKKANWSNLTLWRISQCVYDHLQTGTLFTPNVEDKPIDQKCYPQVHKPDTVIGDEILGTYDSIRINYIMRQSECLRHIQLRFQ